MRWIVNQKTKRRCIMKKTILCFVLLGTVQVFGAVQSPGVQKSDTEERVEPDFTQVDCDVIFEEAEERNNNFLEAKGAYAEASMAYYQSSIIHDQALVELEEFKALKAIFIAETERKFVDVSHALYEANRLLVELELLSHLDEEFNLSSQSEYSRANAAYDKAFFENNQVIAEKAIGTAEYDQQIAQASKVVADASLYMLETIKIMAKYESVFTGS